jgi:hypothetical protein
VYRADDAEAAEVQQSEKLEEIWIREIVGFPSRTPGLLQLTRAARFPKRVIQKSVSFGGLKRRSPLGGVGVPQVSHYDQSTHRFIR